MTTTTINTARPHAEQRIVATYHAGLTTRSQLTAVTSATLTLFVLGQLVLRWVLL